MPSSVSDPWRGISGLATTKSTPVGATVRNMATQPEQFFAIYEAAKLKVESGKFSLHEQALVYAWNTAKAQLQRARAAEAETLKLQKQVREQSHNEDILATKLAMMAGTMPEGIDGEGLEIASLLVKH